ncbi:unnamed protein product [Caretta caretta]
MKTAAAILFLTLGLFSSFQDAVGQGHRVSLTLTLNELSLAPIRVKTLEIFALTSMENAESSGVLSADMELNPICF